MPRTAVITAITHDGKDELVMGRSAPLLAVKAEFKKYRLQATQGGHDKFASVTYQESDGHAEQVRFNTQERHAQLEAQRTKDNAAQDAALKKAQVKDKAAEPKPKSEKAAADKSA